MHPKKLVVVIGLTVAVFSCKKDDYTPEPPPVDPPATDIVVKENTRLSAAVSSETTGSYLSGLITDEAGLPLANVSVACGNATVTTNAKGIFQFPSLLTVSKQYAVISASLNGYFKSIRTFTPDASGKGNQYVELKLLKETSEKTVAASGGNVVLDNVISLEFPASAVVTASGAAYTGQFKVSARYIDPTAANFFETMPGMLTGLNDENQLQALLSFGMAAVTLRDMSGNPLQVAPGKTVKMVLPALTNSPDTIPLWHFNEKYGLWIKAGGAKKNGNIYTAEVNHFSTWNLDLEFNDYKLDLQFKNSTGSALAGLQVRAYTQSMQKITSFFTDNEGKATLINCPASESIILKAVFECDTLTKTLEPLTASRAEDVVLANSPNLKTYTINGKLTGCDNNALANQAFQLIITGTGKGKGIPGVTDAQGNYSMSGAVCNTVSVATVQAFAYLNNEYRYSPVATVNTGNNTYDATICDTTTTIADNFVVVFPDPGVDTVVRMEISKPSGPIFYGDIKDVEELSFKLTTISDLTGLEYFTNLKDFYSAASSFTDISPLQNLAKLETIDIAATDGTVFDLSPLAQMQQLQQLAISSKQLSDLSPVQSLTNLTAVILMSDALTNLSPLAGMSKLVYFELHASQLTDVSVLQNFTNLEELIMTGTKVSNVSAISNLSKLKLLDLSHNQLTDISALQNLTLLEELSLTDNKVSSITTLQSLSKLKNLGANFNAITDLTALQNLTQLEWLQVEANKITTALPLQNLNKLYHVSLSANEIATVAGLAGLDSLKSLDISANKISDITPLITGVPALLTLSVMNQAGVPVPEVQINAFQASHPACYVYW